MEVAATDTFVQDLLNKTFNHDVMEPWFRRLDEDLMAATVLDQDEQQLHVSLGGVADVEEPLEVTGGRQRGGVGSHSSVGVADAASQWRVTEWPSSDQRARTLKRVVGPLWPVFGALGMLETQLARRR